MINWAIETCLRTNLLLNTTKDLSGVCFDEADCYVGSKEAILASGSRNTMQNTVRPLYAHIALQHVYACSVSMTSTLIQQHRPGHRCVFQNTRALYPAFHSWTADVMVLIPPIVCTMFGRSLF